MNAFQMRRVISQDPILTHCVEGVYAVDSLPLQLREGHGIIVNSGEWATSGAHWLVLYMDYNGGGEFFDSLAQKPEQCDVRFSEYLTARCNRITYNSVPLQDENSEACGKFCIYYLAHRCRGLDMHDILSHFSLNTMLNEAIVDTYVC